MSHLTASHLIISSTTKLPYKPPRSNIPMLEDLIEDFYTVPEDLSSNTVPSLKAVILVDNTPNCATTHDIPAATPFSKLLDSASVSEVASRDGKLIVESQSNPNDVINIQFTSGTTSSPKAACLTHMGVLNNGYFIGTRMGIGPGDVVCCPPPLFHCFGCVLG